MLQCVDELCFIGYRVDTRFKELRDGVGGQYIYIANIYPTALSHWLIQPFPCQVLSEYKAAANAALLCVSYKDDS